MNLKVSRLLEVSEPLRCAGTALSDLIEESPYIAFLKDAQTGQYIQGNFHWAEDLGLESTNDVYGLTIDDLTGTDGIYTKWNFSPSFTSWKDSMNQEVKKLEHQAHITKRQISQHDIGFTSKGFIFFRNFIKHPVLSFDNKKTIAILTYNQDLTLQRSLFDLLKIYQQFYSEQKAIQYLLIYLNIDGYFIELPNCKEIEVLFALHQTSDFSDEKAHSTFRHLRAKVKDENWGEMLTRLRAIPTNTP